MSTPRDDPIVCYADFYPPACWDYIQEQRGEDSTSDFWAGMTLDYHAMIEKATKSFHEHLEFDHQTTKTGEDFCLNPTDSGPINLDMWRTLKERVLERSETLHSIAEEEEPEEPAEVKETSQEVPELPAPLPEKPTIERAVATSDSPAPKDKVPELTAPLPEQPTIEKPVAISDSPAPEVKESFDPKPIGYELAPGSILSEYSPGYATSTSYTSTTSKMTAPLPEQPTIEKAVAISDSPAPEDKEPFDPKPIGYELAPGSILSEYSPGYATSTSCTSTTSKMTAALPEQPNIEKAFAISDSPAEDKKPFSPRPIGYGLAWGSIFSDYSPGYATSASCTSTTSKGITWAPLPDTPKPPRKPPRFRRLRQSLDILRGLLCHWFRLL